MKSKKIGLIYAFWTLLWLGIGYMEFVDWQEDIQMRVRIAFDTAMKEEKKLQIKKMAWNFDVERSPNDISGEEKREWLEQFFLTSKDPNRHLLDSLFHTMLVQEDIGVEWSAVSCTFGGKVRAAVPIEQLKKDLLVEERHYRKDYKEENQIVLCVYIQFMALWKNGIFYGWVAVWLIGIMGILYWMRKWNVQKRCVEQEGPILHEEIVPYEPVPIRWVRLREDLLFDEEHGILKSGERTLQLQNLDLDYFRAFLICC